MNSRHLTPTALVLLACAQTSLLPAQRISRSVGVAATPSPSQQAVDFVQTKRALVRALNLATNPTGQNGPANILIVPSPETPPQALATLPEDMTVMSRIFDRRLSQDYLSAGNFGAGDYDTLLSTLGRSRPATEAIFLQDYGVLFFVKVDFPLVPPPKTEEEADEQERPTDPLWAEELQRLRYPELVAYKADKEPAPEYSAERVDRLKETALRTLKHAANVRALGPSDRLVVTLAHAPKGGTALYKYYTTGRRRSGRAATRALDLDVPLTLLTIRVAKSDVDSFAAGKLDLEQFTKKAEILTSVAHLPSGSPAAGEPYFR